jgi:hypothetical protein
MNHSTTSIAYKNVKNTRKNLAASFCGELIGVTGDIGMLEGEGLGLSTFDEPDLKGVTSILSEGTCRVSSGAAFESMRAAIQLNSNVPVGPIFWPKSVLR